MALTAPIVNGEIQDTSASQDSLASKGSGNSNSSLDKDAFLQLLVAQMKYQDPLEPTSNTEFISQFATFSELEEMQNIRLSMDIQRAQDLVGKEVIVRSTNSRTGNTTYKSGIVDYIVVESGKAYLAIEDEKYSLDDLDTVVDKTYSDSYKKAESFVANLAKLPGVETLTTDYMEDVFELKETYEAMTDYEKSFIAEDVVKLLDKYVTKMEDLMSLEGLTYEKEEVPTTEDLLQDLLDKIDKIISDVGNIASGSDKDDAGSVDDETQGSGSTDDETQGSGSVDDETQGSDSVDDETQGSGSTDDETGGTESSGSDSDSGSEESSTGEAGGE